MSYNGSGTFQINSSGQPVVTGTVISSTAFNALTADLATGLSTAITKDGQTTTTVRVPFAQGISSTLVTDATSATTGSIITAGGISTQKALWVGTTTTLAGALTYGGVALNNAVTGTGNMVLSESPTLSGTVGGALTFSGALTLSSALTYGGVTLSNSVTGTGSMVLNNGASFDSGSGAVPISFNSSAASGVFIPWKNSGTVIGYIGASTQLGGGYSASDFGIRSSGAMPFYTSGASLAGAFGSDQSFLVGTTTNAGAGNISCSGTLQFGSYTGTPVTSAGYITVKDAAGNTRKLMVGT